MFKGSIEQLGSDNFTPLIKQLGSAKVTPKVQDES
jgi:hypothetical protein